MKKTIYIGGAIVIGVIVGLYLLGASQKKVNVPSNDAQDILIRCIENDTKITLHNIYRCIDGEWVYVGSDIDNNKG